MFIKICGITNLKDAQNAVTFGADALGFIFANSPRKMTPEKAKEIIAGIRGNVLKIGVFADEALEKVEDIIKYCGLDAAQLHGDESPEYCAKLKAGRVIKTVRVRDETSIRFMNRYDAVFAYLLDTFSEDNRGGTGRIFDWNIAVKAKSMGKPIILAGGLNLNNIAIAVKFVMPYGVDICSSIESEPGNKDDEAMKRIIEEIKALDE